MLITSNRGKSREYEGIFRGSGIELESVTMSYPEEQLDTIEAVAERSASYLSGLFKEEFFIDDSGLFIASLRGFPGVYSSYVNKTIGCRGIISLMEGLEDRRAAFKTCIAFRDDRIHLFTSNVQGRISTEMRGNNGFGFDPIFIPEGQSKTFAEMSIELKNSVSHRSKAARMLIDYIKKKKI